jgi:hypothetical protein
VRGCNKTQIFADNLSKFGWSWGCVSAMDSNGRTIWIADAHRDDGKRLVLHADEKLTAFVKFESAHGKRAASPTESDSDRRTHAKNSGAELLPGKPRESSLLAEMR